MKTIWPSGAQPLRKEIYHATLQKPLRHRDYVYKLHPVEPYHDNCPCTGHQVVDWVGEQIEDVQEVAEEAVEGLKEYGPHDIGRASLSGWDDGH